MNNQQWILEALKLVYKTTEKYDYTWLTVTAKSSIYEDPFLQITSDNMNMLKCVEDLFSGEIVYINPFIDNLKLLMIKRRGQESGK